MYFVVDIEATCWEKRNVRDKNEIIELGIVICNDNGDIQGDFQSFVRPKYNQQLSRFCRDLTRIKQEWIDGAETLSDVLPRAIKWSRSKFNVETEKTAWSAFGDWDESCLRRDCERSNLLFPFGRFINLKSLYANYGGCDTCGLKQAILLEKLQWQGQNHRALDDARNAVKLARFLIVESVLSEQVEGFETEPPVASS